jgi:hypothetical protein
MSTKFKTLLSLTAIAVFLVSATAMADFRDYNYKAWNSIYLREHATAARSNRATTPMVARSQTAPVEVAQAPTNERAYSYEPATNSDSAQAPANQAAPKAKTTNRSFSYEPGATYSAPAVRYRSFGGGNSYENAMRAKGY